VEVAIAGGHGKIATALGGLLAERGDVAFGLIRDPAHEADLHAVGIEPVLCDLEAEGDVSAAVRGADAVVFAAGAGPGSSAERKWTVDYGGAVKLIEAARAEGIRRYLMISAMGAADPPEGGEVFGEYLRAKAAADRKLVESGLEYTIVRPGSLTDDPPTGLVKVGDALEQGQIPRADVAAVLLACLDSRHTIDSTFELIGGDDPIADAVATL
jgi:uncharacterized protein YbjT (DUF2867 family)